MPFSKAILRSFIRLAVVLSLLNASCFRKKKYENQITKDTLQPDKILFDKAVADIERSRFEVARLTLNTMMNTYDTSEYLAKAKLAIADSWFREGGGHGLAQAEAEYKDFILFYPNMEESAEAQEKVCMIHVKQMEKADRDPKHAMRADDECRLLLTQFPNSKCAPQAQQRLREIQEVLAEHEAVAGRLYRHKGSLPASANRLHAPLSAFPRHSGGSGYTPGGGGADGAGKGEGEKGGNWCPKRGPVQRQSQKPRGAGEIPPPGPRPPPTKRLTLPQPPPSPTTLPPRPPQTRS